MYAGASSVTMRVSASAVRAAMDRRTRAMSALASSSAIAPRVMVVQQRRQPRIDERNPPALDDGRRLATHRHRDHVGPTGMFCHAHNTRRSPHIVTQFALRQARDHAAPSRYSVEVKQRRLLRQPIRYLALGIEKLDARRSLSFDLQHEPRFAIGVEQVDDGRAAAILADEQPLIPRLRFRPRRLDGRRSRIGILECVRHDAARK